MILTCPECATSYFVEDSRIPASGRTVKCTSCGARWTASREPPPSEPAPEREPEARQSPAETKVAPDPALADDLAVVAAEPVREPFRLRTDGPGFSPAREAKAKAFMWAAAAVAVIGVVASAILFRAQVVRIWPTSQAAYAGLGLPVEGPGLIIEAVRVEPTFQGGRPVLSVTGSIRNVKDEALDAPPIRINLLNRAGQAVAAKIARPLDARIPARALRHFAIAIADPPANAQDLEVRFEGPDARRAASVGASLPPQPAVEPVDAQPLPPGTPDSLTEHG